MDKQNSIQLELFAQSRDSAEKRNRISDSFLTYIWNYEKTILIIITMVITGIISFSLGVERGKRLSLLNNNPRFDAALEIRPAATKPDPKQTTQQQQSYPLRPGNNAATTVKEYNLIYTIQLASYKTKESAQKEAQVLKKRGLLPLVLYKGDYAVLCVGNFSNREAARSPLSQLRKHYQDCYVRRL